MNSKHKRNCFVKAGLYLALAGFFILPINHAIASSAKVQVVNEASTDVCEQKGGGAVLDKCWKMENFVTQPGDEIKTDDVGYKYGTTKTVTVINIAPQESGKVTYSFDIKPYNSSSSISKGTCKFDFDFSKKSLAVSNVSPSQPCRLYNKYYSFSDDKYIIMFAVDD